VGNAFGFYFMNQPKEANPDDPAIGAACLAREPYRDALVIGERPYHWDYSTHTCEFQD
jgi:hypothetical protein